MNQKELNFKLSVVWTGNKGTGTSSYTDYDRNHTISVDNKTPLLCSADPFFRGDGAKYNPEDMLIGAASACHMLWYLHLCADAGITVIQYEDKATGILILPQDGPGRFSEISLYPSVTILEKEKIESAKELHKIANKKCFIANSLNFQINHFVNILVH